MDVKKVGLSNFNEKHSSTKLHKFNFETNSRCKVAKQTQNCYMNGQILRKNFSKTLCLSDCEQ